MVGGAGQHVGERGHAGCRVGEADLEGECERNEKENQQEQQRRQNDEPAARTIYRFHQSRRNVAPGTIVRDKPTAGYRFSRLAAACEAGLAVASRISPAGSGADKGSGRATRSRQRQRLIDACISALHIHGPSRTTVEKVVAIADLSPGIVRFYFDSKAAMLVASLEYLSSEFEQQVLLPVSQLRQTPVQALELLVDLYLDADIASPRKVSVWYSFWGEASSRQEYYDICGNRDEEFARLVRELIERMIAASDAKHLDADGVALGLIGVLEVLWQGFAFQSEASIDRAAARARALAYLRSVFPGEFPRAPPPAPAAEPEADNEPRSSPAVTVAASE